MVVNRSALLQLFLITGSAILSVLISFKLGVYAILLTSLVLLFSIIVIRKKLFHAIFLGVLVSIALIPSNYVSSLRLNTAFGDLRPSFLLMLMFLAVSPVIILLVKQKLDSHISKLSLCLAAYFLASCVSNFYNGGGLSQFNASFIVFLYGFGMLLLAAIGSYYIEPMKMVKTGLIISTTVSAIGIVEFFGFQVYRSLYEVDSPIFFYAIDSATTGLRRIVSSVGNPLVLSSYLLLCLPFLLYLREQTSKRFYLNASIIMHVLAIMFSQSRSSLIVLGLIVLIFSVQKASTFVRNTAIFSSVVVLFIAVLSSFGLLTRFTDRLLFNTEAESYSLRFEAYSVAFNIFERNSFLGLGSDIVNAIYASGAFKMATLDNIFLTVLVSTGLIGSIIFIVILITLFIAIKGLHPKIRPVGLSLLVTFIVVGFSFSFISYDIVWGMFWLFIGLVMIMNKRLNENMEKDASQ